MYDFLLFENYHFAQHHKIDVVLIARMLQSQGLEVAILNIYGEDNLPDIEGIPVVNLPFQAEIPSGRKIPFLLRQHRYYKKVIKDIEPMAKNFYCGSYYELMPSLLFTIQKPCYYWGLRSRRMSHLWHHTFTANPMYGLHAMRIKPVFMRNPFQRLFVSNNIILEEHARLGVPRNRMVIREERCIENKQGAHSEKLSSEFSFLTIGQLRPDKRIDYTVSEFLKVGTACRYMLVGKSQVTYEKVIESAIDGHTNIERVNKFLDYADFNAYFSMSHFVVFADRRQKGSVSNGTMMEALINYRPIIAPDYNPYKYYIETYGIGILYDSDKEGDLTRAMQQALEMGCQTFNENIDKFLDTILFDKLAKKLVEEIKQLF